MHSTRYRSLGPLIRAITERPATIMDRLGAQAIGRPSNRIVRPGILIPAKRSRRPTRKSPVWTIKPKPLRIPGEDFCASAYEG